MKDLLVAEWLTFLLCIPEVPGSDVGSEIGYPDLGFSWFSSDPPGKCWYSALKLGHERLLPRPFQFIIHFLSTLHLERKAYYSLNI
jgi:hypothetical protein